MAAPGWPRLALWSLTAFALLLCNQYAAVFFPVPPAGSAAGQLAGLVYLALLLGVLLGEARAATLLPQPGRILLLTGLVLAAPYVLLLYLRMQRVFPPLWLLLTANNLFLPAAAALGGTALGRRFGHPNTLLAAAGFAAFFDIVMVTMGTVAVALQHAPQVVSAVSVGGPIGVPGGRALPLLSTVTIGPADVLFIAIFLAGVARLGLERRATLVALYVLLLAALAVAQLTPLPGPALAPMGLAVVLANARHARFTRDEKVALLYGGAFALVLAAVMVAGARTLLAP
jgi:hypothetical protein